MKKDKDHASETTVAISTVGVIDASQNGFANKRAESLYDYQLQVRQLNAIADTSSIVLSSHITKALRDAAKSIDELSLKYSVAEK